MNTIFRNVAVFGMLLVAISNVPGQDNDLPVFYEVNWQEVLKEPEIAAELNIEKGQIVKLIGKLTDDRNLVIDFLKDVSKMGELDNDQLNDMVNRSADELPAMQVKSLKGSLPPDKFERLVTLSYWAAINNYGTGFTEVVLSDEFKHTLEISKSQERNLKTKSKKLQAEFDAELLKLRARYFKEIAEKVLPEQQSAKLSALLDKPPEKITSTVRF